MKNAPETENQYLELKIVPVSGQYFTYLEGTDSRYYDLQHSAPVYACSIKKTDLDNGQDCFLNLMANICFEKIVAWEAPPGEWLLFYFIQRSADYYADTLDAGVCAKFIEETHQKYKEKLSPEAFSYIRGFYTDEPAMLYFETGIDNYVLPWTNRLLTLFEETYGYDLRPLLPHLYISINERSAQIRLDYYRLLTRQYNLSFFSQISSWCHKNGKLFTGHLLYEESVRRHAKTNGNLFASWKHFDMIGVDHLYPRIGDRNRKDEHIALKLASSAAHHYGSSRLLCESMGGFYWDCTIERMKWVADWQYVLGVNLLNPHGFHYTIEGERKRDWPPSQFYHHGWWQYYQMFNDYLSRLGYILSGGVHVAQIAVLYPIYSVWANYTPQKQDGFSQLLELELNYFADTLLRLHYDYDFIDENILDQCRIENGILKINDENYSLILLPPLTHISIHTLDCLERFVKSGGHVAASALLPVHGLNGENLTRRVLDLFRHKNSHFEAGEGFHTDPTFGRLQNVLQSLIRPDITITDTEIFCLHKIKHGHDFYFFINPTEKSRSFTVLLSGEFTPSLWDALRGDIRTLSVYSVNNGHTSFEWTLPPRGSALFGTEPYNDPGYLSHITRAAFHVCSVDNCNIAGYSAAPSEVLELPDSWDFTCSGDNALILDQFFISPAGESTVPPCGDLSGWTKCTAGAWGTQLDPLQAQIKYPFNLWYAADFISTCIPHKVSILIDGFRGVSFHLFINGKKVENSPHRSTLDAEISSVNITDYLKKGKNRIAILLTVSAPSHGLLDLLKITGDFSVDNDNRMIPPCHNICTGDWGVQGYPYFSGIGVYTTRLFLKPDKNSLYVLRFDPGKDAAGITINDSHTIDYPWGPYEADITQFIHNSLNKFSIQIANTLSNLLQKSRLPSGLFEAKIYRYELLHCKNSDILR